MRGLSSCITESATSFALEFLTLLKLLVLTFALSEDREDCAGDCFTAELNAFGAMGTVVSAYYLAHPT